jgi:ferrous iron transport protein B
MMGLYLFGVLVALAVAWIAARFIRLQEKSFFLLELPVYKMPQWKNVFYMMIEKARIFITDAGKVILFISLILWALSSYGPAEKMKQTAAYFDRAIALHPESEKTLSAEKEAALLRDSYAGHLGKYLEPVIQPLGYDWKIGIALITSFAAREVFVGTMATLYSVGGNEDDLQTLREKMATAKRPDGTNVYSLATGISLMLFYLLAMQCMSTLAVVKRETNSWKWPIVQLLYMSGLAYLISFVAFQLLK